MKDKLSRLLIRKFIKFVKENYLQTKVQFTQEILIMIMQINKISKNSMDPLNTKMEI